MDGDIHDMMEHPIVQRIRDLGSGPADLFSRLAAEVRAQKCDLRL